MNLNALASGLLWVWFVLFPPAQGGYAGLLVEDISQLRQPQSVRFRLVGGVESAGQRLPITGQGAVVTPDRFQLALDVAGQRLEQVAIGDTLYTKTSADRDWQVVNLSEGRDRLPPGLVAPPGPVALPSEAPEALAAAIESFDLVGAETIDGVPTRHYSGTLDLLALASAFGDAPPIPAEAGTFTMTIDFWIGTEDHYLRQVRLGIDVRTTQANPLASAGSNELKADLMLSFFDFDQPIVIAAPGTQPATPTPVTRPAPVQVPAQGGRTPSRLPDTGQWPLAALATPAAAAVMLTVGCWLRRPRRACSRRSPGPGERVG